MAEIDRASVAAEIGTKLLRHIEDAYSDGMVIGLEVVSVMIQRLSAENPAFTLADALSLMQRFVVSTRELRAASDRLKAERSALDDLAETGILLMREKAATRG